MKLQPAVKQETAKIAVGVVILTALMVSVFLVIGQFQFSVLLSALAGAAMAILNFFLLAFSVQKATEQMDGVRLPPEEEPPEGEATDEKQEKPLSPQAVRAKHSMQLSYAGRMLVLAVYAIGAVSIPSVQPVAALVPLLFPRIVILINSLIPKSGKSQKEAKGHE